MNYWKVQREWEGETCAILGGGPSMSLEVANEVRGKCRVIAINNTAIDIGRQKAIAPWADILYAADAIWWMKNTEAASKFKGRRVWMRPNNGYTPPVIEDTLVLNNGGPRGFDDRIDHLRGGSNSGYQAMHLAAHLGVKKIILLGFEMHANKGSHWEGGTHIWRGGSNNANYAVFIEAFQSGAPEFKKRCIEIVNATKDSALKCFVKMTLKEALHGVRPMCKDEAVGTSDAKKVVGETGTGASDRTRAPTADCRAGEA